MQLWLRRLDDLNARPIPGTEGARGPVLSPDGATVAFRVGTRIVTLPLAGGPRFTVTDVGETAEAGMDWAPDGLIYNTDGNEDIWIKDLRNRTALRLTFDEALDIRPRWSPDGQMVTFPSNSDGRWRLLSRRADGVGDAVTLYDFQDTPYELGNGEGFWGPNQEWLILRRSGGTRRSRDIFAIRPEVDSLPIALLTDRWHQASPALSPDGRWLAYVSNETGQWEVVVRPFPDVDTGRWQVSGNGGRTPVWAHNGAELFFVDSDRNLTVAQVETGPSFRVVDTRILFTLPSSYFVSSPEPSLDISADDERFLSARRVEEDLPADTRLVWVQNWFEELEARVPN